MKVGDLVTMPGSSYRDKTEAEATGIVLRANGPGPPRVLVYWTTDAEASWEPCCWLEVISESWRSGKV